MGRAGNAVGLVVGGVAVTIRAAGMGEGCFATAGAGRGGRIVRATDCMEDAAGGLAVAVEGGFCAVIPGPLLSGRDASGGAFDRDGGAAGTRDEIAISGLGAVRDAVGMTLEAVSRGAGAKRCKDTGGLIEAWGARA
jgi:hypothetical protein